MSQQEEQNDMGQEELIEAVPADPMSWYETVIQSVTRPGVASYEKIINASNATKTRAQIMIAVFALIEVFFGLQENIDRYADMLFEDAWIVIVLFSLILGPVGAIVSYEIGAWVLDWLAGKFGGIKEGAKTFIALAAFMPFLGLIDSAAEAAGWISRSIWLEWIIRAPLMIYQAFLCLIAVRAVYQFKWGKSIAVVSLAALCVVVVAVILGICMYGSI